MADKVLTPKHLVANAISAVMTLADPGVNGGVAATSSADCFITPVSDRMVIVLIDTGGGGAVSIQAGYGAPLAGQGSVDKTLASSGVYAVYVETARCKAQGDYEIDPSTLVVSASSGETDGIRIRVAANTTVYAIALP